MSTRHEREPDAIVRESNRHAIDPERDAIDPELDRLIAATRAVAAGADFTTRVMTAVENEGTPMFDRPTRHALTLAMLVAVVALFMAERSARAYDDTLVSTYDESAAELAW